MWTSGSAPGTGRLMDTVDLLVCDGCQRRFTSINGPAMLMALKGPCPDCGGRFQLHGRGSTATAVAFDRPFADIDPRERARPLNR